MTARCCYYGIYAELKMSKTPTNPGRMFWGLQKYSSGNGCEFFRWAYANDSTYQEQFNIKNPSMSLGQGRQPRHRRQGRQERQGSNTNIDISVIMIVVIWFLAIICKIY
ncbi:hypothetical protein R3W88_032967 [Solanum pinnatisectum]|uniref:Zinc finger GRF-type domain-containing protein n=1 Tax=Solanum pinnatisectum TaxID=50273 RepID=A0AAV9K456_9SOLN|nr:hypothetical protein R3W88_032967 [Solanum pinnatisectum]